MQASELRFDRDGAEIIRGAVGQEDIRAIAEAFAGTAAGRPGIRSIDVAPAVLHIVRPDGALGGLAQWFGSTGDSPMRAVRIVFFDKSPDANWAVPWHQDRTIAVQQRHDLPGFGSWNTKQGVTHVEPPVDLLMRMVTLRLHLDDTGEDNGPLDIVPASHLMGRIPASQIAKLAGDKASVRCLAKAGDVLAMRLVTLHKSERASRPSRRRVLHVDYSQDALPPPLRWYL